MKEEFNLKKKRNEIIKLFDASKLLRDMQTGRMIGLRMIVKEVLGYVEDVDIESKKKLKEKFSLDEDCYTPLAIHEIIDKHHRR